jgi:hypothetical protein
MILFYYLGLCTAFPQYQEVMDVLPLFLLLKLITHVSVTRYVITKPAARSFFRNMLEHIR